MTVSKRSTPNEHTVHTNRETYQKRAHKCESKQLRVVGFCFWGSDFLGFWSLKFHLLDICIFLQFSWKVQPEQYTLFQMSWKVQPEEYTLFQISWKVQPEHYTLFQMSWNVQPEHFTIFQMSINVQPEHLSIFQISINAKLYHVLIFQISIIYKLCRIRDLPNSHNCSTCFSNFDQLFNLNNY